MELNFFEGMSLPIVCAFCLILGFILKKWIKDVNNKYIPTVLTVIGAILGCVIKADISVENIVYGAFSGLASTGMHQVFKQLIGNNDQNNQSK